MKNLTLFALTTSLLSLVCGEANATDYVLTLKPKFNCPTGQILFQGTCVAYNADLEGTGEQGSENQNNQNNQNNENQTDNPSEEPTNNPSEEPATSSTPCEFHGDCGSGRYCDNGTCASCVTNGSATCPHCADLFAAQMYIGEGGNYWNGSSCVKCVIDGNCGSGQTCNTTSHECEAAAPSGCPAGEEYSDGSCVPCYYGYYKDHVGNDACTPCPSHSDTDALGSTSCVCGLGYTLVGSTCEPCPIGSWKGYAGNGACTQCETGQTTNSTGSSDEYSCWVCAAGYTGNGLECTACPAGTYKSTTGSGSCTQCPSGTTSPAGSTSSSACQSSGGSTCNGECDDDFTPCSCCENEDATKPYWDFSSSKCVECTYDDHCGEGQVCNASGECASPCPNGSGYCQYCANSDPVSPYWDGDYCVQCLGDDDCDGGTCSEYGECL